MSVRAAAGAGEVRLWQAFKGMWQSGKHVLETRAGRREAILHLLSVAWLPAHGARPPRCNVCNVSVGAPLALSELCLVKPHAMRARQRPPHGTRSRWETQRGTCAMKMTVSASYRAVPFMLTVAPRGSTNWHTCHRKQPTLSALPHPCPLSLLHRQPSLHSYVVTTPLHRSHLCLPHLCAPRLPTSQSVSLPSPVASLPLQLITARHAPHSIFSTSGSRG